MTLRGLLLRHGRLREEVGEADEEPQEVLGPVDVRGAEHRAVFAVA